MKYLTLILLLVLAAKDMSAEFTCYSCRNCNDPLEQGNLITCNADNMIETTTPETTTKSDETTVTDDTTITGETITTDESITTDGPITTDVIITTDGPITTDGVISTEAPISTEGIISTEQPISTDGIIIGVEKNEVISKILNQRNIPQVFHRYKRHTRQEVTDYVCYMYTHEVDGAPTTDRGCVRRYENPSESCDLANTPGVEYTDCKICDTNECNSATNIQISLFTLFTTIFIILRLH